MDFLFNYMLMFDVIFAFDLSVQFLFFYVCTFFLLDISNYLIECRLSPLCTITKIVYSNVEFVCPFIFDQVSFDFEGSC